MNTTSAKKILFFIICLLLLPHPLTAMKRPGGRTRGGKIARTNNRQNPTQCNQEPNELWLPNDVWVSIALTDLSTLKTLRETSHVVCDALKTITLDYLKDRIIQGPETAKGIAKNFYVCSKLLYRYGKELNKTAFNTLWNNQPINDKGIRTDFIKKITKNIATRSITPLQVFNVTDISYQGTECDYYNNYYEFNHLIDYLHEALLQKNALRVYLASSFAFYDRIKLNETMMLHNIYQGETILFLFEACKHSSIECLQILLDYGADPGIKRYNDGRSLLHLILGVRDKGNTLYIDHKAEKIELILHYYNKTRSHKKLPQKNKIINRIANKGTPLSCAIDLFSHKTISLDELISIINVLLKYGADPKKKICTHKDKSTVFRQISKYITGNAFGSLTQEEADIIINCLRSKQRNIITD